MLNMSTPTQSLHPEPPKLLEVLKYAASPRQHTDGKVFKIAIVSNFTDDLLKKILIGLCAIEGFNFDVYAVPFKQYFFELKNKQSKLYTFKADITFIFFDVNTYRNSEFIKDPSHLKETLADIESLCGASQGTVVINTCIVPTDIQFGRLFKNSAIENVVQDFNVQIRDIEKKYVNVHILDTNRIVQKIGWDDVYDLRNLFAFYQPFTNDFLYLVSIEWFSYIKATLGKVYKCIVVDLDNTLWGKIVGEVGPMGIDLGSEYPGNAYIEFQRILLDFYDRGIILAINSRNNLSDVKEVFEKNPNMVLKEDHFAAIYANWETKADNLRNISKDLNIGLDSIVFIDDDEMNRDLVRTQLPEVLVPNFSVGPEEFPKILLNIDAFQTLTLTEEDKQRGGMYVAERKRKELQSIVPTVDEYLATLNIHINLKLNDLSCVARLAQMTQKTNQFNLTTKRSTESEMISLINNGALVYAAEVEDKFGSYGLTLAAICIPESESTVLLDTFLMSCRVMGRKVEFAFFSAIVDHLQREGYKGMKGSFIQTEKNAPSESFLSDVGGVLIEEGDKAALYTIDLQSIAGKRNKIDISVTDNFNT